MSRGMKIGLAAMLTVVALFAGYRIYLSFLPEETRIRRLLGRMEDGFNAGEAGTITSELAEDFTEEKSGLNRSEIRLILIDFFRNQLDKDGNLLLRVEALPAETEVTIHEGEPRTAEVTVLARFQSRGTDGSAWAPFGTIRFTGRLRQAGGEWRLLGARHEKIEGRWPF